MLLLGTLWPHQSWVIRDSTRDEFASSLAVSAKISLKDAFAIVDATPALTKYRDGLIADPRFAGMWIEYSTGTPVVKVAGTDDLPGPVTALPVLRVTRTVPLAILGKTADEATRTGLAAVVDEPSGVVKVADPNTKTQDPPTLKISQLSAKFPGVSVQLTQIQPATPTCVGCSINFPDRICTTSFRFNTDKVGTAAHCRNDSTNYGPAVYEDCSIDFQLHNSTAPTTVTTTSNTYVGQPVAFYGRATGTWVSDTVAESWLIQMKKPTAECFDAIVPAYRLQNSSYIEGDSGGPVITGGDAVGWNSANTGGGTSGLPIRGNFVSMSHALSAGYSAG